MSEKTIRLFELVEKFNNFCNSVDYIEKKAASDIVSSALSKINDILGTLVAEVSIVNSETHKDTGIEYITGLNTIAVGEINGNNVYINIGDLHPLFTSDQTRRDYKKDAKKLGKDPGFLRTYLFEKQHLIVIDSWEWKRSNGRHHTINQSPYAIKKDEHEEIPFDYEPLLYEGSNSAIVFPLFYYIEKKYAVSSETSKNLLGLLHLQHSKERAIVPNHKVDKKKYPIPLLKHCPNGTQFEVLKFFADSVAKLLTKYVEWEKSKSDTKSAIKRFEEFNPDKPYEDHGGVFIRPRDGSFKDIQSKLKEWFNTEGISCEYGNDRSDPSEEDIQKSFFGVFDITGFHPKVMTELGEAIAKGKPSLVIRDYNDAVVSEKVPEKIMRSGSAIFCNYCREKEDRIFFIEKINDDGTYDEFFEEFDMVNTLKSFVNSVKPQHSLSDN